MNLGVLASHQEPRLRGSLSHAKREGEGVRAISGSRNDHTAWRCCFSC
jgi:hypothetical protein